MMEQPLCVFCREHFLKPHRNTECGWHDGEECDCLCWKGTTRFIGGGVVTDPRRLAEQATTLADKATPGPWAYNSYSAIHSLPAMQEYNELEALIPDDADDDDPRWGALPDTVTAVVPRVAGDTATTQGALDAAFIAAARELVPDLAAALTAALDRYDIAIDVISNAPHEVGCGATIYDRGRARWMQCSCWKHDALRTLSKERAT